MSEWSWSAELSPCRACWPHVAGQGNNFLHSALTAVAQRPTTRNCQDRTFLSVAGFAPGNYLQHFHGRPPLRFHIARSASAVRHGASFLAAEKTPAPGPHMIRMLGEGMGPTARFDLAAYGNEAPAGVERAIDELNECLEVQAIDVVPSDNFCGGEAEQLVCEVGADLSALDGLIATPV